MAFLSLAQVAEVLGVSHRTAQRIVASGQLPVHRIGSRGRGQLRISHADLEGYLERTRVTGPT